MSESLKAAEALAAKGAVAPRVSLQDIEDAIAAEYTTTLDLAFRDSPIHPSLRIITVHAIVMNNGFVVLGKSAPASPENFSAEKGYTFAREDAINQLWPLMGFSLKDRLASGAAK
jgi:hypothetical protein